MSFTYKHLTSWRGLGKAFNDLSWENLIAAALGGWGGNQVSSWLPGLPWWAVYPPPILAALALTWPVQGRLLGVLLTLWARYYLRRLLAPATLEIYSAHYYRPPLRPQRGIRSDRLRIDPVEGPDRGERSPLPPALRPAPAPPETGGPR